MFKKAIKISGQNQLSGKDRKIMRNRLVELFNEECIDKIMNINDKIIACKTSGTKVIIYNGNDYPLFVDQNGKNDYFPTLYTAIAYEPLIKILVIN
jgi:predicted ribosome-associated RNA-binding protein Tma20